MNKRPRLTTPRLLLRPLELGDAADIQTLASDRDVATNTENIAHPYEDGMAERWIESSKKRFSRGELVNFAITLLPSGPFIGSVALIISPSLDSPGPSEAELSYWIGKPYWGSGYATEAAQAAVRYGFNDLGLERVRAFHFTRNSASGRVLEKIGMSYKGHLDHQLQKLGEWEDLEEYEILPADIPTGIK